MGQEGIYVGIDVAKAKVDVAVRPTGERWEVPRDEAGIPQLVSEMKTLGPSLVLLEATGGLELPLVAALAAEALPVVVVNPRQVRDFARVSISTVIDPACVVVQRIRPYKWKAKMSAWLVDDGGGFA